MNAAEPTVIDLDPYTFGPTQTCFGCGPHNERGLQLRFQRDGDTVTTRFVLGSGHDGPPDLLHGGLQALICDELAGWVTVGLRGRIGVTSSMNVRYIRGIRLGEPCEGLGELIAEGDGMMIVRCRLVQAGQLCCTAKVSFVMADSARMEELLPKGVPEGWHHFFDGPAKTPATE